MHGVENSIRKVWRERPLGIPSHRWKGNIRMDLREIKVVCACVHTQTREATSSHYFTSVYWQCSSCVACVRSRAVTAEGRNR